MNKSLYVLMLMTVFALTPERNAFVKNFLSFDIYLTAESVDRGILIDGKGDWSRIRLADSPLISASDISRYNFSEHSLTLRPEVFDRIPRPPWEGTPFVVVVNGERIYFPTWLLIHRPYK
jgi:hypothetical protein